MAKIIMWEIEHGKLWELSAVPQLADSPFLPEEGAVYIINSSHN